MERVTFFELGRKNLLDLKLKALRCGTWFRVLSRIDRALVDLTLKVADRIRSFTLARNILSIVKKLEEAVKSRVLYATKHVGFPLARKLSLVAQRWGNPFAKSWMSDLSFARFLAVMHINDSRGLYR